MRCCTFPSYIMIPALPINISTTTLPILPPRYSQPIFNPHYRSYSLLLLSKSQYPPHHPCRFRHRTFPSLPPQLLLIFIHCHSLRFRSPQQRTWRYFLPYFLHMLVLILCLRLWCQSPPVSSSVCTDNLHLSFGELRGVWDGTGDQVGETDDEEAEGECCAEEGGGEVGAGVECWWHDGAKGVTPR